ncbi:MAG: YebC/PmpR family DNA-binding transcriptional regulator [Candidatus Omnitrophica bacterium]|nr:YebC/PmpR family DNA-binding transcriptional regulator [Candidatus Omnitrophota bacterium]
MSGHSKWASIKHKKGALDAKRGKIFSKISREIIVAAKSGGGDPESNARLRLAVSKAREANMPSDNVDRAIKRGTGELEGINYEETAFEGYGPGGVAVYVQCLTDNKNRTSAEIRNIFSKKGGNLAGLGSVSWLFEKKGLMIVDAHGVTEEELMNAALDAGAEDLKNEGDAFSVITQPHDFENVKQALAVKKIPFKSAEITMLAKNLVPADEKAARQVFELVEALEENDDVQNVYTNMDVPENVLKELA